MNIIWVVIFFFHRANTHKVSYLGKKNNKLDFEIHYFVNHLLK